MIRIKSKVAVVYAIGVMLTGCYGEAANGLPEPTMEVVTPASEKEEATIEVEAEDTARSTGDDSVLVLSLNLSDSVLFETVEEDMATYHDEIEVWYVEDEAILEAMYTSEALAPIREHLEAYTYNTLTGSIGLVSDPSSLYVLCNKLNKLPADYVPEDLIEPDVPFSFSGSDMKRNLRADAAHALEDLFAVAKEEGIDLFGVSGYRSYGRQDTIYAYNVSTRGVEATDRVSARPGHSEHQTGLAIDVSAASVGYALEKTLGDTDEGVWLKENAYKFGFVIRYQDDVISNTGYDYEPWHIRYIGQDVAGFMYEYDLTLETIYATFLKGM